jgi:uncharacterized protein YacL
VQFLESLVTLFEPWSAFYSDSQVISVALTFVHLGAMMVGGGLAIGVDRMVLETSSLSDATVRMAALKSVATAHRPVLTALTLSVISGLLQLTADLEGLAMSRVLWTKFGLIFALLANGLWMQRNERALFRDIGSDSALGALKLRAVTSLLLWFAITLAGVGLMQG